MTLLIIQPCVWIVTQLLLHQNFFCPINSGETMSTMAATNDRPSKPFSLSFGSRSKPAAAKVTPKKRNYATLTADDSDKEQEAPPGKAQLVHAFDQAAGGALGLNKKEEKGPLVIPSQKNLDWREEARRRRGGANLLPAEEQARRAGANHTDDDNVEGEKPIYGLLITDKTQINGDVQMEEVKVEIKPKSADEEALDALLGKKESTMIIEQAEQEDTRFQSRTNDTHAFRADIASRPDPASLADYEAVPIEDFGLALLRGQGYKLGDPIGRRKTAAPTVARVPQKRANLLGIGAKEVPEGMEEMGAWGKGAQKGAKKGSKIDRSYNPLVLRNRETGEVLTEAELQARKEQQSLVLEIVSEKKSRRNRDYDDEKYESSRHSSSRRDTSQPRNRKERRDKDYDRDRQNKDDKRSQRERDYNDGDHDRRKDRKDYQDDNHDRRDRRDRDDYKSSRDKEGSRRERQKDDYEDRRYKEKRRDDRR